MPQNSGQRTIQLKKHLVQNIIRSETDLTSPRITIIIIRAVYTVQMRVIKPSAVIKLLILGEDENSG
jgi:hypothetical protein